MSMLHTKTKKVTTYGRKKTHIIPVLDDFADSTPNKSPYIYNDTAPASPLAHTTKPPSSRPPLQSKLSSTVVSNYNYSLEDDLGGDLDLDFGIAKGKSKTTSKSMKAGLSKVDEDYKPKVRRKKVESTTVKQREIIDSVEITSTKKPSARERKYEITTEVTDLTAQLASTTITSPRSPSPTPPLPANTLADLLVASTTPTIQEFNAILSSPVLTNLFPSQTKGTEELKMKKIGEASYSEVFLLINETSDVVVKIIPLSPEAESSEGDKFEGPDRSDVGDVLREIGITKRMASVGGGGFIEFLGAFVVEGVYPERLLDEWDSYKSTEGSSSIRPGCFPQTQQYALLILSNGGSDLENFKFSSKNGWEQACGVFWQVVSALASAEEEVEFEHRDLHEGQILIQPISTTTSSSGADYTNPKQVGLKTTIIDFGLSRLSLPEPKSSTSTLSVEKSSSRREGNKTEGVMYATYPDDVYEGKGRQWDVYREIRDLVEGDWEGYWAVTNVMWLQYILHHLMHRTSLRPPPIQRPNRTRAIPTSKLDSEAELKRKEREREAYRILKGVEGVLKDGLGDLRSAGGLLELGRGRGWVL